MKTILLTLCVAVCVSVNAQNFGTGNFVVFRAGDGVASLANTGNIIFLDEFTTAGSLVRSIELPSTNTAPTNNIVTNGTNNTEGNISRSPNGLYITFAAYNSPSPIPYSASLLTSASTAVPRIIVWLANNATINSLSTTDWCSTNAPRTAVTNDATQFWIGGGTGGVNYRAVSGSATVAVSNSTVTSVRNLQIYNGNLYASSTTGTPKLGTVGTGLPTTTSQTITALPGFVGSSPHQFVFLDLNPSIAGVDVMYVADESTTGAIKKYSYDGTTWLLNGQIGLTTDVYRGIIASANGSTVTLFSTRNSGTGTGGGAALVTAIDNAGYNAAPSSVTPTMVDTLSNSTKKAYRGLAWAPTATALPVDLQSFNARAENDYVKVWFTTSTEVNVNNFVIEKSVNGVDFAAITSIPAKNTNQLNSYAFNDANVISNVSYYRLKIIDNDGSFKYSKIVGVTTNALTVKSLKLLTNPVVNGSLNIVHAKASNATTINVFSSDSKLVKSFKVAAGNTQSIIDISNLQKGNYVLELVDTANNINQSISFVKQ